ncbi:MAG TPA: hypothetical protein DCS07_04600 [Bdellovibrionales bacterium]|nr:MAG: hypothetical protein A2Z97_12560 [Bdellovibrionales bacterium GWB1_52_6]OFZ04795.1 MAG: hypothetical protein A2X97_13830 [Bdellovibrionales bacterium GWA1_52_35]OFZ42813.1 MAG: hypothetical protein A2070_05680 [Bdellovibrionales bacterium GWC1_52_8]HAR41900.1 hypothetical protein [Bdellovibrionales bacterium]HCM39615.1 hypothetical protein [Bdellovibrionales bacterium]
MAAASSEDNRDSQEISSGGSSGGGSKLVLALTGVNILVTLAMIAILFISFQKEKKHSSVNDISTASAANEGSAEGADKEGAPGGGKPGEGAKKRASDFGKMVTLEQFTVNLATPGSVNPKFVRVNISLEVPSEDSEAEVNLKMPQVRNVIIDLFNSKRPADLATAEGRDYLKDEIRTAINTFLMTGKVKGVFFTSFAMTT